MYFKTLPYRSDKLSKMRKTSVLLIEDDPEYTRLVTAVLSGSASSIDLHAAATLHAGLALAARLKPDLILLDLNLPDCSGYDTFLRVKVRIPETPIVVLTGIDDEATAMKAAEDGAHDYLVKGLQQPKVIARSVKMALRKHARRNPNKDAVACSELYFG